MKIEIFENFELIDMLYAYDKVKFVRKFRGDGELLITLQTFEYVQSLSVDNIVLINNEAYFITGFTKYKSSSLIESYKVMGLHINSILKRRTLIAPYTVSTALTYEQHLLNLLNQNIISPQNTKRKISNFIFKNKGYTEKSKENYVLEKQSLFQAVNMICENAGLGYKISYDVNNKQFVFELLKGNDRTEEVIFSEKFYNVENSELTKDTTYYSNVCYLNNSGVMTEYGDENGINRRETFVEGKDIAEAIKKLNESGIKENVNTDILKTEQFEYKEDWDLGDIVTFIDDSVGFIVAKPIEQISETYGSRYILEVDFGKKIPILR